MRCVKSLNGGKGVSLSDIVDKMKQANVSRVELSKSDVQHLMQTLAFDYMIEHAGENLSGESLYVAAKRVTTHCEFKCKYDLLILCIIKSEVRTLTLTCHHQ